MRPLSIPLGQGMGGPSVGSVRPLGSARVHFITFYIKTFDAARKVLALVLFKSLFCLETQSWDKKSWSWSWF